MRVIRLLGEFNKVIVLFSISTIWILPFGFHIADMVASKLMNPRQFERSLATIVYLIVANNSFCTLSEILIDEGLSSSSMMTSSAIISMHYKRSRSPFPIPSSPIVFFVFLTFLDFRKLMLPFRKTQVSKRILKFF